MSPDRDPLDELLASIADGAPIDWEATRAGTQPEKRGRLEALDAVSRLADFSRTLQRGDTFPGAPAPGSPTHPDRWGDFLLLERIHTGNRAELYRAWDVRLRREVALKLLRPGEEVDAEASAQLLLQEGRTAARIRHPNVVTVHGSDRHEGRVGFWMEFLRGTTLEQEVAGGGSLDPERVRRLGLEIGAALGAVHEAGLLHRDIKPSNILRDERDQYVLADFGLGQSAGTLPDLADLSGTPMYMAPELFDGEAPSVRSDLYSLGMTLRYALTGRHPFPAGSLTELVARIRQGPEPLESAFPEVPRDLATLVARAAARRPEDRLPSVRHVLRELEAGVAVSAGSTAGFRVGSRRVLAGLAGVVVVGAAAGILLLRSGREAGPPAPEPMMAASPDRGYAVQATFLRRDAEGTTRLNQGDRVQPGDRLSLELLVTRPAWVYVLNEDEDGRHYLLFPQPRFDQGNPIPADSTWILPGTIGGKENAWAVTSAGGREHLLVAVSPDPIPDLEAELERIPLASPGRPVEYASIGAEALEVLRGVGGVRELPADVPAGSSGSGLFDRVLALAGREERVEGIWVRRVILENPRH